MWAFNEDSSSWYGKKNRILFYINHRLVVYFLLLEDERGYWRKVKLPKSVVGIEEIKKFLEFDFSFPRSNVYHAEGEDWVD